MGKIPIEQDIILSHNTIFLLIFPMDFSKYSISILKPNDAWKGMFFAI
jgi:hypothetical protein